MAGERCGKAAYFKVAIPDEDVESQTCDQHLAEAVRACYVDFEAAAVVTTLSAAVIEAETETCDWVGAVEYAFVMAERVAVLHNPAITPVHPRTWHDLLARHEYEFSYLLPGQRVARMARMGYLGRESLNDGFVFDARGGKNDLGTQTLPKDTLFRRITEVPRAMGERYVGRKV